MGDRNTGKTALVIDTIINQRTKDLGLPQVVCVYCAIGQKRGSIARTVAKLHDEAAMDYTIVVAASASTPAAMQYLAPFAACAIGEYFMERAGTRWWSTTTSRVTRGRIGRSPSSLAAPRAARHTPGDIFYLHSRLLERAAKLSKAKGGGSLTALPVIQTQASGRLRLHPDERHLHHRRPDLSRDGPVQRGHPARGERGPLRVPRRRQGAVEGAPPGLGAAAPELAQYQSLAAFSQFGSDLDEATQRRIARGKRIVEILKQPQFAPLDDLTQMVSIHAAGAGLLTRCPWRGSPSSSGA